MVLPFRPGFLKKRPGFSLTPTNLTMKIHIECAVLLTACFLSCNSSPKKEVNYGYINPKTIVSMKVHTGDLPDSLKNQDSSVVYIGTKRVVVYSSSCCSQKKNSNK
jgi:hypothetical protein